MLLRVLFTATVLNLLPVSRIVAATRSLTEGDPAHCSLDSKHQETAVEEGTFFECACVNFLFISL